MLSECNFTHYGADCSQSCSVNCVQGACTSETGVCTYGCKTGFYGDMCNSECRRCPQGCDRKWGIAASIVQLEDLGNCVKEHATKGVWMDVPRFREHVTVVSLEDVEISVTSHATYSINANTTHLNVRIYILTFKGEVWSSCTFEYKNVNIS